MVLEWTMEVGDAEIARKFTAVSFHIDQIRKEKCWFLEIKRIATEFTLSGGSDDGAREEDDINTDPVCKRVRAWVRWREGVWDWLGYARLAETFCVWYCLTITSKSPCFDLVAVEIRLMLPFWKLVVSFHYFITYTE